MQGKYTGIQFKNIEDHNPAVSYKKKLYEKKNYVFHKDFLFTLLFIEEGNCSLLIDHTELSLEKGSLSLIFPEREHILKVNKRAIIHKLDINNKFFNPIISDFKFMFSLYQKKTPIQVENKRIDSLLHEFQGINFELNYNIPNLEILNARLAIIAEIVNNEIMVYLHNHKIENIEKSPILSKFIALLDTYYKEEKFASFYADKLNITSNYLNILCKKSFSCSSSDIIKFRTILAAKELLLMTSISINKIGEELGYDDISYFSRIFKSTTGMTPREYREHIQNQDN